MSDQNKTEANSLDQKEQMKKGLRAVWRHVRPFKKGGKGVRYPFPLLLGKGGQVPFPFTSDILTICLASLVPTSAIIAIMS